MADGSQAWPQAKRATVGHDEHNGPQAKVPRLHLAAPREDGHGNTTRAIPQDVLSLLVACGGLYDWELESLRTTGKTCSVTVGHGLELAQLAYRQGSIVKYRKVLPILALRQVSPAWFCDSSVGRALQQIGNWRASLLREAFGLPGSYNGCPELQRLGFPPYVNKFALRYAGPSHFYDLRDPTPRRQWHPWVQPRRRARASRDGRVGSDGSSSSS